MTLTEISYYSRRLVPFAIIIFLVLLIFFYGVRLLFLLIKSNQSATVETKITFGKLNRPQVPEVLSTSGLTFNLDTIDAKTITASPSAKVLFMPPSSSRFGYREKMYVIAKTLGINTEVTRHKFFDKEAVFEDEAQKLTIDISNFNFTYQSFFEKYSDMFASVVSPAGKASHDDAVAFLNSIGRYPRELSAGKTNTSYFNYNPADRSIGSVENVDQANVVRVDFYRPDIEGYPSVSPSYFNSPNYVLFMYTDTGDVKILRAQVKFYEISADQEGVYPIRSGQMAFDDLKAGKGLIVSNPTGGKSINIKKMFVGYYDPDIYQEYLQPIYVFLGENNFVAYVPAISEEYLTE